MRRAGKDPTESDAARQAIATADDFITNLPNNPQYLIGNP
jgi:hypothetical protein